MIFIFNTLKKAKFTFIYCLCLSFKTYAQPNPADYQNQKTELVELIKQAEQNISSNPDKSLNLAKKAETIALKLKDSTNQASIFTILGNIYGLYQARSDRAADYHRQAFRIYHQKYKTNQLEGRRLYAFFIENVTPIYELISSVQYNRKRRDKVAIRNYQALYTELSRFFLENEIKKNLISDKNLKEVVRQEKSLTNDGRIMVFERLSSLKMLSAEQKKLYLNYIKVLEANLIKKGFDISKIRNDFDEQNQLVNLKIDTLNLLIVQKDSIAKQDSLLARQKMDLLTAKNQAKESEYQLQKADNQRNMIILLLSSFFLAVFALTLWLNLSVIKKQKKEIEQQNADLQKSQQELDQFAYRVSHDLRSPIASGLGLINIAKSETDVQEVQKYLGLMEKSFSKMDEYIKDVLAHSQNTRTDLEIQKIDLLKLIDNILSQYYFDLMENKIELQLDIPQNLDFNSDMYRLKIILNNLITNSIRYFDSSKSNRFLNIKAQIKGQDLHLTIEDNGLGIAEEHQQKVFDMFYRANTLTKGSGLGLYLVKQSVEKIKGAISLKSKIGEGTAFSLILPNLSI